MSTRRIECGWRFEDHGQGKVTVIEDGGLRSFTLTFPSGTFAHMDVSSLTGVAQFGQQFESSLDTGSIAAGGVGGYSVTYDETLSQYMITKGTGTFELDFAAHGADGDRLRRILGMTGNKTGSTVVSDQTPWYVVFDSDATAEGFDSDSYDYDPGDRASFAVALDGSTYAQGPTGSVRYRDFEFQALDRSRTIKAHKPSVEAFTAQELVEMAGVELPVAAWSGLASDPFIVGYLRPEGGFWSRDVRSRFSPNSDLLWTVKWRLVIVGEVWP